MSSTPHPPDPDMILWDFRDETLTIAMAAVLTGSVAVCVGVWVLTGSLIHFAWTVPAGFLATFTGTPHVVAWWLDVDVDELVDPDERG